LVQHRWWCWWHIARWMCAMWMRSAVCDAVALQALSYSSPVFWFSASEFAYFSCKSLAVTREKCGTGSNMCACMWSGCSEHISDHNMRPLHGSVVIETLALKCWVFFVVIKLSTPRSILAPNVTTHPSRAHTNFMLELFVEECKPWFRQGIKLMLLSSASQQAFIIVSFVLA